VNEIAETLMTLGGLFLLGLATDVLGRLTPLPRVTLLLLFGFAIGPDSFDLLPEPVLGWFPTVAHLALVMVGFMLGERLSIRHLHEHGRLVLWISLAVVLCTGLTVGAGLWLLGFPIAVAVLLAAIATATAPAATADVVREARDTGHFSSTLLGIVALDDAWGLLLFSAALAAVHSDGSPGAALPVLLEGARDLAGALALGVGLGIPMAYLTGRVVPGEPTLAEALGGVFLCSGVALWLDVSFLLACMVLGAVVASLARHHERPFHAIEGVEWPFMILFFVLAGASLRVEALTTLGTLGAGYVALRVLGRLLGAWAGGWASGAAAPVRRWMGVALLPQAGVALGMALVASQQVPELAETILPVAIGATVLFEVVGPIMTRIALSRAGDLAAAPGDRPGSP
jgi:Kef-type K+ transport system membrane component KefB